MTVTDAMKAEHAEYRRLLRARKNKAALAAWMRAKADAIAHGWTSFQFIAWCHRVEGR